MHQRPQHGLQETHHQQLTTNWTTFKQLERVSLCNIKTVKVSSNKYVGPLIADQNVHWPHHMLLPGESQWVTMPMGQTDGQTPDHYIYITLSTRLGQQNN